MYQLGQFVLVVAPSLVLSDQPYEQLVVMYTTTSIVVLAGLIALHGAVLRVERFSSDMARASAACFLLAVPLALVAIGATFAFGVTGSAIVAAAAFSGAAIVQGDILLRASLCAREGRPLRTAHIEFWTGASVAAWATLLTALSADAVLEWGAAYLASSLIAWVLVLMVTRPSRHTARSERTASLAGAILVDGRILLLSGWLMSAFNRVDFLVLSVLASDAESTRYALATRFAGPALVGLSALNNSVFIRQLERRHTAADLGAYTSAVVPRIIRITIVVCLISMVGLVLLTQLVESFRERHLLVPSAILLLATCLFAASVPWAYALNAIGREQLWMRIVAAMLAFDAFLVALVGYRNAVACALCWLATQVIVLVAVRRTARRLGLAVVPEAAIGSGL